MRRRRDEGRERTPRRAARRSRIAGSLDSAVVRVQVRGVGEAQVVQERSVGCCCSSALESDVEEEEVRGCERDDDGEEEAVAAVGRSLKTAEATARAVPWLDECGAEVAAAAADQPGWELKAPKRMTNDAAADSAAGVVVPVVVVGGDDEQEEAGRTDPRAAVQEDHTHPDGVGASEWEVEAGHPSCPSVVLEEDTHSTSRHHGQRHYRTSDRHHRSRASCDGGDGAAPTRSHCRDEVVVAAGVLAVGVAAAVAAVADEHVRRDGDDGVDGPGLALAAVRMHL